METLNISRLFSVLWASFTFVSNYGSILSAPHFIYDWFIIATCFELT